ncbi:hypothetical protein F4810DRAFT_698247 [Camillea tinctor]|nr:hypothetical protein F4810DRAFT_698247 [Camillea tinctor]
MSDSNGYTPKRCVPPRCRLCQLPISKNEQFIAIKDYGLQSAQYAYALVLKDETLGLKLRPCDGLCSHSQGLLNGYHPECAAYIKHMSRETFEWFLRVTKYSFEPRESEIPRRQNYIRRYIETLIQVTLRPIFDIPKEVCSIIRKNLDHRPYAIKTTVDQLKSGISRLNPELSSRIDIESGLWVQYVVLDHHHYISALGNTRNVETSSCVLAADKAKRVDTLYVLHDHLGVRQMKFTEPGDGIESLGTNGSMGRAWWETISLSTKTVWVEFDGLKLRRITNSAESASTESHCVTWPVPMPQNQIDPLHFHDIRKFASKSTSRDFLRMIPVELNSKETTGISVCWNRLPIAIYGHKKGEKPPVYPSPEKSFRDAVWIYTPLNAGEIIVSMWLLYNDKASTVSLTVETNKGRVVTIGYYRVIQPPIPDRRVFKATEGASRIYFDDSPIGIRQLATSSPYEERQAPSLKASFKINKELLTKTLIYTSAPLRNVSEVVPCQRTYRDYSQITGLLFCYSDGTLASVGDFKLDRDHRTLQVGSSKNLCLGLVNNEKQHYVSRIEVDPLADRGSLEWVEYPWEGEIEWLFDCWRTHVYHNDRSSQELQ